MDCVVFGLDESELKVLLIERALDPFKGKWALPGGFVRVDETLDEAARRELEEEAGLKNVFLEQLYTFGEMKRDPRERVVSVAYYSLPLRPWLGFSSIRCSHFIMPMNIMIQKIRMEISMWEV